MDGHLSRFPRGPVSHRNASPRCVVVRIRFKFFWNLSSRARHARKYQSGKDKRSNETEGQRGRISASDRTLETDYMK